MTDIIKDNLDKLKKLSSVLREKEILEAAEVKEILEVSEDKSCDTGTPS